MPEDVESKLTRIEHLVFEEAVERATRAATQQVAQVHRRRLIGYTAVIIVVIMAAIGSFVITAVSDSNNATRINNQRGNCVLLTNIATIMSNFVNSDAKLRSEQALANKKIAALRPGVLKRLLQDPETVRLTSISRAQDTQTTNYWEHTLVPQLRGLAAVDCVQRVH